MRPVIHHKTGNFYLIIEETIIDTTNSEPEDKQMVLYMNLNGMKFVRERAEFFKKFKVVYENDIHYIDRKYINQDQVKFLNEASAKLGNMSQEEFDEKTKDYNDGVDEDEWGNNAKAIMNSELTSTQKIAEGIVGKIQKIEDMSKEEYENYMKNNVKGLTEAQEIAEDIREYFYTRCPRCNSRTFNTPSGVVCEEGHGGLLTKEECE